MRTFKVTGMTCGHCAQTVTGAVEALPSVERALVDLELGELTVEGEADEQAIQQAVKQAGYQVEERLSPERS